MLRFSEAADRVGPGARSEDQHGGGGTDVLEHWANRGHNVVDHGAIADLEVRWLELSELVE